jgi:carboxymethylenebutenolidase
VTGFGVRSRSVSITTRYEKVAARDGGEFDAYGAIPEAGHGPGVLVFQEIFGINDNMRGLAERLAGAGFVALVPDMFWRIEPRFERKDESGMADAFAIVQQFDRDAGIADIAATHAHLLAMPECTGKIGAVGFCLGGALAFACAATSRVHGRGPDAAVCYYGSGINDMLGLVEAIKCPTMYHYGNDDAFIPPENISDVENAVADQPGAVFHRYAAGHAFSNWDAPSMYREGPATEAWARTIDFFHRTLD